MPIATWGNGLWNISVISNRATRKSRASFVDWVPCEEALSQSFSNHDAFSVASGSLGDGSFPWTVPKNLVSYGSDYRIKVTSNEAPSYTDISDKAFTISGPTLDVTLRTVGRPGEGGPSNHHLDLH